MFIKKLHHPECKSIWQGTQRIGLLTIYLDKILAAPTIRHTTYYTLKGKTLFWSYSTLPRSSPKLTKHYYPSIQYPLAANTLVADINKTAFLWCHCYHRMRRILWKHRMFNWWLRWSTLILHANRHTIVTTDYLVYIDH
jgi:hypothetical protein